MIKSPKEKELRKELGRALKSLDHDLLSGVYTLPNGEFDRDGFEDVCRPIIYHVLGWEEGNVEDRDTPAICFDLCLDIAKKRKRYMTKQHKPKCLKPLRQRLQTVKEEPGPMDYGEHPEEGHALGPGAMDDEKHPEEGRVVIDVEEDEIDVQALFSSSQEAESQEISPAAAAPRVDDVQCASCPKQLKMEECFPESVRSVKGDLVFAQCSSCYKASEATISSYDANARNERKLEKERYVLLLDYTNF